MDDEGWAGNDGQVARMRPGERSWPITATTFVLMPRKANDPAQTAEALRFFRWSLEQGKAEARGLNYVPLPEGLVEQIEAYWGAAK